VFQIGAPPEIVTPASQTSAPPVFSTASSSTTEADVPTETASPAPTLLVAESTVVQADAAPQISPVAASSPAQVSTLPETASPAPKTSASPAASVAASSPAQVAALPPATAEVRVQPQATRELRQEARPEPAPERPIPANPDAILAYSQNRWRDSRYEVFQWQDMASVFNAPILIFDTASYRIQSRFLKRLAFFVERSGARGQLLTDQQLAHRLDWYAHDYQAEDLAAFFNTAASTNFPLSAEELELRDILLDADILRGGQNNRFIAGNGAVISISRESSNELRSRFMIHEGFHGLFFLDEEFRTFSSRRYENLNAQAKRYLLAYFSYLGYDTSYPFLVVNEFMAYVLQQSLAANSDFFGGNVLNSINNRIQVTSLPEILTAFQAEAVAFSAYVGQRWGFAAGRLRQITAAQSMAVLPSHYVIQYGDTLSGIAARQGVYWDSRLWEIIYDANREQLPNPNIIRPGLVLNIPAIQGENRAGDWEADHAYEKPF
jgi:nucleoid-associated protein YgaU